MAEPKGTVANRLEAADRRTSSDPTGEGQTRSPSNVSLGPGSSDSMSPLDVASTYVTHRHPLVREALRVALDADEAFEVTGVFGDERQMLVAAGLDAPAIVVLDGTLAAETGFRAVSELRERESATRIVLLADTVHTALVRSALEQGVDGLLVQSLPTADIVAALRHVLRGHAVLPREWQAAVGPSAGQTPLDLLSARQLEVLELLAEGRPNEEIARRLFISVNTVKFHIRGIYEKLGVRNRVEASRLLASSESRTRAAYG